MSQPTTIHVPVAADGACAPNSFAVDLNDSLDALVSSHIGSSRPSYAAEGTIWVDSVTGSRRDINIFDGVNDIRIASYDPTTHTLTYIGIPTHGIDIDKLEADIFDALASDTPDATDFLVGIDTSDDNKTKKFALPDILNLASASFPAGSVMLWAGAFTPAGWAFCDGSAFSRTLFASLYSAIGTTWGAGDGSTTFNVPDLRGRTPVGAGAGATIEKFLFSSVNVSTDVITVASNADKWVTGKKVRASTSGGLPAPLVGGTDYYVIRVSATTIKLAASLVNATAGTAINLTTQGTGTHTLTETLTSRAVADQGGEESHTLSDTEMPSHAHTYSSLGSSGGSLTYTAGGTLKNLALATSSAGGDVPHNNMQPYAAINYIIKT